MASSAVSYYRRFRDWRAPIGETQRFLLLAILIGIFAGLMVVAFHVAIVALGWFTRETPYGASKLITLLLPAAGALVSVFLIEQVFRGAKGSGVVDTKAAIYISDGYVPFSAVIGKFIACAMSIGTGNSLGPEDPALHMGAGVASRLGRSFNLTRDRMRLMAPLGAAAGLAAAFNTPISAVLFVIEEVLAGWSAAVLGSIVLAAVSATVVLRLFLGSHPLFLVPAFELTHISELIVYAAVGLVGGLLSVVFVKAVKYLRTQLARLPRAMHYVLPTMSGLAVGFAGLWLPQVMGAGYGAIDSALHDRYAWNMLLLIGAVKVAATLVCFSATTPGGMFAPTLFIGAMIGGGLGGLAQLHWPFPTSPVSGYVLVGMGTFFAGVFRAPMTSIFMVFEVSASYVIILPVMIANTIAYLVSRRLQRVPFFTMLAAEEGIDLPSLEEQRESHLLSVEDAMSPPPEVVLTKETSVKKALAEARREEMLLVAEGGGRWSVVTRPQLEEAAAKGADRPLTKAVPLQSLPRVHRDMLLDAAMRLLGDHPLLPVASRRRPYRLIGTLSLRDVRRAYGIVVRPAKADRPRPGRPGPGMPPAKPAAGMEAAPESG